MSRPRQSISVVIPVYCEGHQIAVSLARIRGAMVASIVEFELVVVDDGSTDDTRRILETLLPEMPELRALSLSRNFGKEAAIRAGLAAARGDGVLVMDSDLQHPPELIPEMLRLWREQLFDVVNAVKSRRADEASLRGLFSKLYYWLFERLSGSELKDASDFKLIDRSVVEAYCALPERNLFVRGLVGWLGFRQASVPFEVAARNAGSSKWSTPKLTALAVNSITAFSTIPLHFVTLSGLLFLLFAIGLGLQTLYRVIAGNALEGFPTVILLLLISSSVLMIALGIIGQYLAKIYEEVKRRPHYLLRDPSEDAPGGDPQTSGRSAPMAPVQSPSPEDRRQTIQPVPHAGSDV
jgi:glycosyltransferase involved in cell wall biosynthesis